MKRRNFDLPHFHRLLEYLCWSINLCTCYHHAKYIITSDWAKFFFLFLQKKHFNAKFHCLLNWYKCRTLRSKQTIQNHRTKCALFMPTCNSFFFINSEWFFQELHASPQVTLEMNVELNIKITDQLLIQNQMYCECL